MSIKKNNGLAGIDIIVAVVAIGIFSTLILSMMTNNVLENVKLKKENLAMIYITEIFENIAIQDFDNAVYKDLNEDYTEITEANILVPQEVIDSYKVELSATTDMDGVTNNENILKKVKVRLTYLAGNKTYTLSMERMKIKE